MREALLRFGDTAKFRGIGKPFAVREDPSPRALRRVLPASRSRDTPPSVPSSDSYSDRNAWLGEIEDARRAGIKAAMNAERPSVRTAVMMTTEL